MALPAAHGGEQRRADARAEYSLTQARQAPERKRYGGDHWSHWDASEASLDRYLALGEAPYNRNKTIVLERLLGEVAGRTVLDYGGGAGDFAVRCARRGARVTLVDSEPGALALARMLAVRSGVAQDLDTYCADSIPGQLQQRRFDMVILKDVIEHIPDDAGFLHEVARLQQPGARLVLSTHSSWSLNFLLEGAYHRYWLGERDWCGWDPTHVRFYSPLSLRRRLRAAGYRVTAWWGIYIVPYDIRSWVSPRARDLRWPVRFDLALGGRFPFNRLGWNVILAAERTTAR